MLLFLAASQVWLVIDTDDVFHLLEAVVGRLRDIEQEVVSAACKVSFLFPTFQHTFLPFRRIGTQPGPLHVDKLFSSSFSLTHSLFCSSPSLALAPSPLIGPKLRASHLG